MFENQHTQIAPVVAGNYDAWASEGAAVGGGGTAERTERGACFHIPYLERVVLRRRNHQSPVIGERYTLDRARVAGRRLEFLAPSDAAAQPLRCSRTMPSRITRLPGRMARTRACSWNT